MAVVREELGLRHCQVSLDLFEPGTRPVDGHVGPLAPWPGPPNGLSVVLHSSFTGLAGYSSNLLLHPDPEARRASRHWFERAIDVTAEMGAAGTGGFLGAFSATRSHKHRGARAADRRARRGHGRALRTRRPGRPFVPSVREHGRPA